MGHIATVGLVASFFGAGTAHASGDLASLPYAAQALTANGGFVVFSQSDPSSGSWRLMVWHAGVISALAVPPRSVPFDADAGPDVHGRPAVVFSRCAVDPPDIGDADTLDWAVARGCHIYELGLPNGLPRRLKQIGLTGASDSTPSLWHGAIAFARVTASKAPSVARVLLWRPRRPLRRLAGGTVPCRPARVCHPPLHEGATEAWVGAMDLGARMLALKWDMQGANVASVGAGWEMRADPLTGGRPRIAYTGGVGGSCEGAAPLSPNAFGDSILYVETLSDCNYPPGSPQFAKSTFASFAPATQRWRTAPAAAGQIAALAQDAKTSYWLRFTPADPKVEDDYAGDCLPEHGTCTLVATDRLALTADPHHFRPGPATFP